MYCLLCHEKIPRLRAWRTKSEFCSDEHAAQYKKQTLDRLLTDQNPARKEKPNPIALSEEEEADLVHDEMSVTLSSNRTPTPDVRPPETVEPVFAADDDGDFSLPGAFGNAHAAANDSQDNQDNVEELWRLADQLDHSDDDMDFLNGSPDVPEVARQSAEDALRALRMLAEKANESRDGEEGAANRASVHYRSGDVSELEGIDDLPPLSDDLIAELESGFSSFDEPPLTVNEVPAPAANAYKPENQGPAGADDGGPSILERLMEDPVADWTSRPADAGPSAEAVSAAGASSLDGQADDMQDPLAEFGEFPEPEFSFDEELVDEDELELTADASFPLAGDDDEVDPLAELIKVEESARAGGGSEDAESDESADSAFDQAVADELVEELAEEGFRDDLDLHELERTLKVVPFPTPEKAPVKNGRHKHSADLEADVDAALAASPLRPADEAEEEQKTARSKSRVKPDRPQRSGRKRTKFKPSMVMAGVEPSLQGYIQGDPLKSWRASAVQSAWGEAGTPVAYDFQIPAPERIAAEDGELQAFRPERHYRGRMGVPMTLCNPAEAPEIEPPSTSLEPARRAASQEPPQAPATPETAAIRLGPEYRVFEDAAALSLTVAEPADAEGASVSLQSSIADAQNPLAPAPFFYDSVPHEERFAEEEEWEMEAEGAGDSSNGIDLSADFANEQPATQSSGGGGRQYR